LSCLAPLSGPSLFDLQPHVYLSYALAHLFFLTGSDTMLDLACGHGLAGVLFAVLESKVSRVILIDKQRPTSHDRIMSAVKKVAPWAVNKVRALPHYKHIIHNISFEVHEYHCTSDGGSVKQ
jgi:ubiquinone/menaquinone biosynthesis C-methylase UbiE